MEAQYYLEKIVVPTIRDYAANRTSVRHCFLACVAAFHTIDYLAARPSSTAIRSEVRKQCPSFVVIDRVAHAFKHVSTGHPESAIKPLYARDVITRPPAVAGQFTVGLSRVGDAFGGVTLSNAPETDLLAELGMVLYYFQKRMSSVTG